MNNLNLKEELVQDNKKRKIKMALLYVVGVPLALVASWGAVTYALAPFTENETSNVQEYVVKSEPPYPHIELGKRCSQGVVSYDAHIESMEQELADFSAKVASDMAAVSQESQDYLDELYDSASQAGPGINHEPVQRTAEEARRMTSDGLYRANQMAADTERGMRDAINDEIGRRNELATCESLVKQEKDIPDYKVMEYERLSDFR